MAVIYLPPQQRNVNPYTSSLWTTALNMAQMKVAANIRAKEAEADRAWKENLYNDEGYMEMVRSGYEPVQEMSREHAELKESGEIVEGYGHPWKKSPEKPPSVQEVTWNGQKFGIINYNGKAELIKPETASTEGKYKVGELKQFETGPETSRWFEYVGGSKVYKIPGTNKTAPIGWKPTEFAKTAKPAEFSDEAKNLAEQNKNAGPLRKEFIGQSKEYVTVRDSYKRIEAAAEDPSAAGDLALIFNYMKVLDPGSVVRESEFATAQNAAGVPERIRAQYNRILNGERLSPETRADFVSRAGKLYDSMEKNHMKLRDEYDRISRGLGVEPSNVVIDYLPEIIKQEEQAKEAKQSLADKYGVTLGDY